MALRSWYDLCIQRVAATGWNARGDGWPREPGLPFGV
jgi:hypothetical protein